LSLVQKGAIGQFAFLATALVTGKGMVEVYTPAVDNEGRDAEIRKQPALPASRTTHDSGTSSPTTMSANFDSMARLS
jgi:hypothetical protein